MSSALRKTVAVLVVAGLLHFSATATVLASQADASTVAVGVTVRTSTLLTIPAAGASAQTLSNSDCFQRGEWVVRDGARVWLITVVPTP